MGGLSIQVSIDGPAGAGKSTVSKAVAQALGFIHIDSGAMYRAVTWLALRQQADLGDEALLSRIAREAEVRFGLAGGAGIGVEAGIGRSVSEAIQAGNREAEETMGGSVAGDGAQQVFCQGVNVTEAIRSLEVSAAVSKVAAVAGVRDALVEAQRQLAASHDVVMDGRDIGTVVLPHAQCKVFLTASPEERARRRMIEREEADNSDGSGGNSGKQNLEAVIAEIRKRDEEDMNRAISPLRPAQDSVTIDTTGMRFAEVVDQLVELVRARTSSDHSLS